MLKEKMYQSSDNDDDAFIYKNDDRKITMCSKSKESTMISLNHFLGIYPQQRNGAPSGMALGSLFALENRMSIRRERQDRALL
mmetsp:Transcript_26270/g.38826  ORF Transcript_26270/g.38826 Transcript_26270/m.38826 type:complete len:83 (-) Transcript_26270:86-334(-)